MKNNKRLFQDIEQVCQKYYFEYADKATQTKINKDVAVVLNYYKLMYPDDYTGETISAKITLVDTIYSIQLVFSPKLHEYYDKR